MKIFYAKDYKTRSDLENAVRNKISLTPDLKPDFLIEGTKVELSNLNLSQKAVFWGISCKLTDPPEEKIVTPPDRGKVFAGGINLTEDKKGKLKNSKKTKKK